MTRVKRQKNVIQNAKSKNQKVKKEKSEMANKSFFEEIKNGKGSKVRSTTYSVKSKE